MSIYLEAPRDKVAARRHTRIPELQSEPAGNVLKVGKGVCLDTDIQFNLASEGFRSCAALILRSSLTKRFGLFHVYPSQEVDDEHYSPQVASLRRLAGSSAILVEGSESSPKRRILRELHTLFTIDVIRTIPVDTVRPEAQREKDDKDTLFAFHVVFRPKANRILVARISHRDVLTFKGF